MKKLFLIVIMCVMGVQVRAYDREALKIAERASFFFAVMCASNANVAGYHAIDKMNDHANPDRDIALYQTFTGGACAFLVLGLALRRIRSELERENIEHPQNVR